MNRSVTGESSNIAASLSPTRIGVALGGGFAQGLAHIGVLRAFERAGLPIHSVAGVSWGAIAAAAFASGCSSREIAAAARMLLSASAENLMSFAMGDFLRGLLKQTLFERMTIPLAIVASDLTAGAPVIFRDHGDVLLPLHASCAYPGLFPPVRYLDHFLVDGMVTMEVPAAPLRRMGATHVVSVAPRGPYEAFDPRDRRSVVARSFAILTARNESHWRRSSDVAICPVVETIEQAIEAGEQAAEEAVPQILEWLPKVAAA